MKYFVVDAFADELFHGNPAGVCLLDHPLPEEQMQQIAFENNLAETAFLIETNGAYQLRWFTPEMEIDLCGHATLATAFVLMHEISPLQNSVCFETKSGLLTVQKERDVLTMDFPARMPVPIEKNAALERALGCRVMETHLSRDLLALVENEKTVADSPVNTELLKQISRDLAFAVIVTAKGEGCDFVSRFFAPNAGIPEDPVTGSAHSTLIPFWHKRLAKSRMTARQLSKRGGTLFCEYCGDRVKIGGTARCYLRGELLL